MEQKQLAKVLREFLRDSENLKTEIRHSYLSNGRTESVAEHVWRTSLLAMLIIPHLKNKVNIERFIKMIIIHDLVEIYAGDIPITESYNNHVVKMLKQQNEQAAMLKIRAKLPIVNANEISDLWNDYEYNLSIESRIAHALDKIEAQAQHNEAGIGTWEKDEYKFAYRLADYVLDEDILKDISELLVNEVDIMLQSTHNQNQTV